MDMNINVGKVGLKQAVEQPIYMCVCLDYEQVREWSKISNIAHVVISW